jgi:hypothetical protein
MITNVFYNHQTVQSLLLVINKLENQISEIESQGQNQQQQQQQQQQSFDKLTPQSLQPINPSSPTHFQSSTSVSSSTTDNTSISSSKDIRKSKETTIEDISAEVGSLTITNNDTIPGCYIGVTTGSNFTKLFLKQLHLNKLNEIESTNLNDFDSFDSSVTRNYAPLPPYRISRYAILKYINHVHIYYPILILQDLKLILHNMYSSPREVSINEKFILFIVVSIGLDRGEKDAELIDYNNQFKPVDYFNTAYRYLEEILTIRSEKSLQSMLLVIIWLLNTNVLKDDNGDLWHLGRFSMSLAMELGVHRFNPDWDFGELKNELRNRLFWCTYILERTISIKFGKGLSLRKQAIDTPLPKLLKDDYIVDNAYINSEVLKIYEQVQFKPSLLLINICEIYGDLLETIYISKSKISSIPHLTGSDVIQFKDQLQNSLTNWMIQVEKEIPNTLDCYHELKIRYCITSIILNRPSPSFPLPDSESIMRCKLDCQTCIDAYCWLIEKGWKINPICLHDTMNIGLTMVYCCWKTESNSKNLKNFSMKILNIMNEIVKYYLNFTKFKNLFIIISSIVVDGFDNTNPLNNQQLNQSQSDYLIHHVTDQLQQVRSSVQYASGKSTSDQLMKNNILEFNDLFTQELFNDVFRKYHFNTNDQTMEDIGQLFDFRL